MSSKHFDALGGFLDCVKGKSEHFHVGCSEIPKTALSFDYLPRQTTCLMNAKVEMRETAEAFVYRCEVAGLKEKEVMVDIVENGRVLQISGQRDTKKDLQHVVTTYRSEFLKSFRLPENSKASETKAYLGFGELNVVVPKIFISITIEDIMDCAN